MRPNSIKNLNKLELFIEKLTFSLKEFLIQCKNTNLFLLLPGKTLKLHILSSFVDYILDNTITIFRKGIFLNAVLFKGDNNPF